MRVLYYENYGPFAEFSPLSREIYFYLERKIAPFTRCDHRVCSIFFLCTMYID